MPCLSPLRGSRQGKKLVNSSDAHYQKCERLWTLPAKDSGHYPIMRFDALSAPTR